MEADIEFVYGCPECNDEDRRVYYKDYQGDIVALPCRCESAQVTYIGKRVNRQFYPCIEPQQPPDLEMMFFNLIHESDSTFSLSLPEETTCQNTQASAAVVEAAKSHVEEESDSIGRAELRYRFVQYHPGSFLIGPEGTLFGKMADCHLQNIRQILENSNPDGMAEMLLGIRTGLFTSKRDQNGNIRPEEAANLHRKTRLFFMCATRLANASSQIPSELKVPHFHLYRVLNSSKAIQDLQVGAQHIEDIPCSTTHDLSFAVKKWVTGAFSCVFEIEVPVRSQVIIFSYPPGYKGSQNPLNQDQAEVLICPSRLTIKERVVGCSAFGKKFVLFRAEMEPISQEDTLKRLITLQSQQSSVPARMDAVLPRNDDRDPVRHAAPDSPRARSGLSHFDPDWREQAADGTANWRTISGLPVRSMPGDEDSDVLTAPRLVPPPPPRHGNDEQSTVARPAKRSRIAKLEEDEEEFLKLAAALEQDDVANDFEDDDEGEEDDLNDSENDNGR
jgi:hypothetical protein